MIKRTTARFGIGWLMLLVSTPGLGQSPFDPPDAATLAEARTIVQQMIDNPRGPYLRLRWYCNDGTIQPPNAFACSERGGGRQHAQYSEQRDRLVSLGWSVGTIYAALDWDELWDGDRRQQRLREISLERYLTDVDAGWILRRALDYRGRIQIEDEEFYGRELLLELLEDPDWIAANFLLVRESARVIPHTGGTEDRTRTVRREAIELVEIDPGFERLRVEIHTTPSASTAGRVREWATDKSGEVFEIAAELARDLDDLYGPSGRRFRLTQQREALAARSATARLAEQLGIDFDAEPELRIRALTTWLRDARTAIASPVQPSTRLLLFDASREVENEIAVVVSEYLDRAELTRGELLALSRRLIDAVYGVGLLTEGEYRKVLDVWPDLDSEAIELHAYAAAVDNLRRLPQWALGSVRYTFAEPLIRYTALEPKAAAFVDDLLRSSSLTGLAETTRRLGRDLAFLTGVSQSIDGRADAAAFGLNAGIASGRLRIFETSEALRNGVYDRSDIVLLPETVAELSRVAGILTLGEGNPLSHVQLLARNFGIPNVAVLPGALPRLRPLQDQEIVLAVASDGSVVLLRAEAVDEDLRALLRPANETGSELTVPRPDLSFTRPIPLAELNSSLSGRVVGPKAANLGQLALLFPNRVAPAVAVPFGIFAEHMNAGNPSLRERLVSAYRRSDQGEITEAELLAELESIRQGVAALEITDEHRSALGAAMNTEFGTNSGTGLFLRSDTNVEDLPQFTGAGLSETLPNLVGRERQLGSIPRIWASVLSPRAIAWRSNLLTNPEEVYASVLLMQSVPSDKSGVMVTRDLTGQGVGLTVSTGWGVGGAVAGEAVETVVLRPDGQVTLVSEAKTAYKRQLDTAGGLRWIPASDGAVLTADEINQLRNLADQVDMRYVPVFDEDGDQRPWDIEFGFVDGELTLFQIRPLVERGPQLADRIVSTLLARPDQQPAENVVLAELPELERN